MTIERGLQICASCVLTGKFPGIDFDDAGLCQYCRGEGDSDSVVARRKTLQAQISAAIETARASPASYQCIVALSGGKDSSYTLLSLVRDEGLRCLAVTVDNGFLSPVAIENCRVVCDELGTDHVFFKPAFGFMRRMYRESLDGGVHAPAAIKRASDICSSCINLINVHMINVAVQNGVQLIAGGYLGGQVPKDSAVLDINIAMMKKMRDSQVKAYQNRFGEDAGRYFALPETGQSDSDVLTIINPLLAVLYDEQKIIAEIAEFGWEKPADTGGHSSNCRLNDVGIVAHQRRYGFHPYVFEMAELVRKGFVPREQALDKLAQIPNQAAFKEILDKLGVSEDRLCRSPDVR